MIYIEYCSRRPGISLDQFHDAWRNGQEGWGGSYQEDRLVWAGARTWRMGPEPEYVAVWHIAGGGFDRLDAWDEIFKSGDADQFEDPFFAAARIDVAGCYNELVEPVQVKGKRYYVEYFTPRGSDDEVRAAYGERESALESAQLLVLATRIGILGPDPGGIAVWSMDSFGQAGSMVEHSNQATGAVEFTDTGLYADVGQEVL